MKQTVAMGAVVATLALAGTQALAGDHLRCETEVAELNIAEADVEGIFTVPKFLSRARRSVPPIVNRRFDGVQAWVSMKLVQGLGGHTHRPILPDSELIRAAASAAWRASRPTRRAPARRHDQGAVAAGRRERVLATPWRGIRSHRSDMFSKG